MQLGLRNLVTMVRFSTCKVLGMTNEYDRTDENSGGLSTYTIFGASQGNRKQEGRCLGEVSGVSMAKRLIV